MHPSIHPYLMYFSLPTGYGPVGVRWDRAGEALETDDGTFAFTRQIASFLEGYATVRPVPHFAYALLSLELLGTHPPTDFPDPERIRIVSATFRKLGLPMRNAGALLGNLCALIPPAAVVPPGGGTSLAHWLVHSPSLGFLHPVGPGNPEVPPFEARTFFDRVAARLRAITDFEVRHWLRHGIGPQDLPAESIAEVLPSPEPGIDEFMDALLRDRPRLSVAVPLVKHFVSALTLPPRRQAPPQIPIGGYADVTTRGDPSRLLPAQFALDPDEFVRRFAEHELLFFRREDPQEKCKENLVLVVDQGVLTWGPVRLALAAAVLAFGRLAARRELSLSVRCGSAPADRFTLPMADAQRLGEVLEASDLSTHPGHALAEEVLDATASDREIVLLTHPRVLGDSEIRRLGNVLANNCRLFALTATEDGHVELVRMRGGGTVPVRRFRIELNGPAQTSPVAPAIKNSTYTPWSGDVEPMPFPFPFGLTSAARRLAFDSDCHRLLAVDDYGFLHAWNLNDGSVEVLPRGAIDGKPALRVESIMGVANGFVVGACFDSGIVAFHYDWSNRTVISHILSMGGDDEETVWHCFPHLHSVVVNFRQSYRAVDLGTGTIESDQDPTRVPGTRAQAAIHAAKDCLLPKPNVPVICTDHSWVPPVPYITHDPATGRLRAVLPGAAVSFVPTTLDRPRFKNATVIGGQLGGEMLALTSLDPRSPWSLHDLKADGRTVAEFPWSGINCQVARLSSNGRLFARQTEFGRLEVTEVLDGSPALVTVPGNRFDSVDVRLGRRCMGIGLEEKGCLLDWSAGPLRVQFDVSPVDSFGGRATNRLYKGQGMFAESRGRSLGMYQLRRWEVGLDIFGQLFFVRNRIVTCVFLYQDNKLAAWSPDGVRYGPMELTGEVETPAALDRLGLILRQTTE